MVTPIRGPDGLWRTMVTMPDGYLAVQIVEPCEALAAFEIDVAFDEPSGWHVSRADEVLLEELVSRCPDGEEKRR